MKRITEMKELLRSMRPSGTIDGHSVLVFDPLRRERDLTVRGRGLLSIQECTVKSGSLCTSNALGCGTPPMTQVAGANAVVPQPKERR